MDLVHHLEDVLIGHTAKLIFRGVQSSQALAVSMARQIHEATVDVAAAEAGLVSGLSSASQHSMQSCCIIQAARHRPMHEELTSAELDIGTQLQISQVAVQTSYKARQSCLDGFQGDGGHDCEHQPALLGQEVLLELESADVKTVRP